MTYVPPSVLRDINKMPYAIVFDTTDDNHCYYDINKNRLTDVRSLQWTQEKIMKLNFVPEKETKNTIRFQEDTFDTDNITIGSLYVQKHTLKNMGWKHGDTLTITIEK